MRAAMKRRVPILIAAIVSTVVLSACGSHGVQVTHDSAAVNQGAQLFASHCSGCHTLSAAGTEGSATKVKDREHTDGPNFNQRKECMASVLYAIRNGGYSGAIMPENIVVGNDAQDVAKFLSKYSGSQKKNSPGSTPTLCTNTP
jgi:mono/diheme cytochrome c family protein